MVNLDPINPLPALQSLTVKDTPIRDEDVGTLVQACPRLGYLCIENPSNGVTGAVVQVIFKGLLSLTSLCISGCAGIGNDVSSVPPALQLERLSIYDCSEITALSCLSIMVAAPKLHKLRAVTCERCALLEDLQLALPVLLPGLLREHMEATKSQGSDSPFDSPHPGDSKAELAGIMALVSDALARQE